MMRRLLTAAVAFGALTAQAPVMKSPAPPPASPSEAELRARYAAPASRFTEIDGETVHYAIEGHGPAILLLHGSFASLRQWDQWAERLRKRYTVIRYDQSPMGLSGPHPKADYSLEHRYRVIDALADMAGAKRFLIVGTSSAGVPAAAYAAAHPNRVTGVILNNIAVGPVRFDMASMPQTLKDALTEDARHPGWHAPEYWRQILLYNVTDKTVVTPALAEEWTLLNNRVLQVPGAAMAAGRSTQTSRTPDDLPRIMAPTLLLWSADDHETRLDREGAKAFELVGAKDKQMVVVDRCGHMMPLDCPVRGLDKAMPFIERVARD